MNNKKIATLNIVISIIFALAIIITTHLYPQYYPTLMYIIIALWFIPSTYLSIQGSKK